MTVSRRTRVPPTRNTPSSSFKMGGFSATNSKVAIASLSIPVQWEPARSYLFLLYTEAGAESRGSLRPGSFPDGTIASKSRASFAVETFLSLVSTAHEKRLHRTIGAAASCSKRADKEKEGKIRLTAADARQR